MVKIEIQIEEEAKKVFKRITTNICDCKLRVCEFNASESEKEACNMLLKKSGLGNKKYEMYNNSSLTEEEILKDMIESLQKEIKK